MKTPVQAMFWQIWRAWRWGFIACGAYLLVAAVVAQLLPGILRRTSFGEAALPGAGQQLAMPCGFIMMHLMFVFLLTGADDLKVKGYSPKMFALPVRTHTLVAWPMLWGCLAVGGVWLFIAGLILRPTGNAAPLIWPMAALALALTMLQALAWMPLAQNWLSSVIAIPLIGALTMFILFMAIFQVPELIATGIYLALLPLTYAACLYNVAAARRGDVFDWGLWNRLVTRLNNWRKPAEHPFRSAARAQLWFECRSVGWSLPLFVLVIAPFFAMLVLASGGKDVATTWKFLAVFVCLPAGLAAMIGTELGSPSFPFVATRPVSTATLVRGKLEMALVSALAAYVPVLLVVPLFLIQPGMFDSAVQAAWESGAPSTALILLLAMVLPVLFTWRGLVENLWVGLAGRAWLTQAMTFGFAGLIGFSTLFGLWVWLHPEVQALLRSLVPWLVGLFIALKLMVACWVLWALVRWQLVRLRTAGLMVGVWGLVALGLFLIAVWLIPSELLHVSSALAAIALFVPFSRLAGAPLSLDWNRHR